MRELLARLLTAGAPCMHTTQLAYNYTTLLYGAMTEVRSNNEPLQNNEITR